MTRSTEARRLRWHVVVLSVYTLGLGLLRVTSARAEAPAESPLAAMRAAAQEAADIEPAPDRSTRQLPARKGKNANDALGTSIRAAVRDEVDRVAAEGTLAPGRSGNAPASNNGNGNGNGNSNNNGNSERHGPSEMGLLHSAASSAQQAKRNVAVQTDHGNGVRAHGTAGAPGQNKGSLGVGAAKR